MSNSPSSKKCLAMLRLGPLVRRGGRWQFGLRRFPDSVVERMVANGKALKIEDRVTLAPVAVKAVRS